MAPQFLRPAPTGKLAPWAWGRSGVPGEGGASWAPSDAEGAPRKPANFKSTELNWGVGDRSQAWGEGKLPLSGTQVYNGKLRGGWQSDPAIGC